MTKYSQSKKKEQTKIILSLAFYNFLRSPKFRHFEDPFQFTVFNRDLNYYAIYRAQAERVGIARRSINGASTLHRGGGEAAVSRTR